MRIHMIPFILLLGGCSGYQNNFDCLPAPGLGCKSMTQVQAHMTENEGEADELSVQNPSEKCLPIELYKVETTSSTCLEMEDGNVLQRIPERVVKIWLNGYINKAGDYEGPRYIYVALKDDTWRILPKDSQNE